MRHWKVDPDTPATDVLREAAAALIEGQLVGVPTETVYGLAADATSSAACARIFSAKGRPQFNPLISHVESVQAVETHAVMNRDAQALAEAFWPGPLTLVLPKKPMSPICDLATSGLPTVALRVPAAPVMRALAERTGRPLAAPSANRSGRISATTAHDVIADLGGSIAGVIDAGPCPVGIESTIIACIDGTPRLLRPGGLSRDDIERVLGKPCTVSATPGAAEPAAPEAPGMLRSHYAPDAHLRLNASTVRPGEALLAFGPVPPEDAEHALATINLSLQGDLIEAAAKLFTALRTLDESGAQMIAVQPVPETGLGEAINDRLRRAAAPRPSTTA